MSDSTRDSDVLRFSLRELLIAFFVASLGIAVVVYVRSCQLERVAEVEQRRKTILATLDKAVKEIEAVRIKLGRAPVDADELQQLMGHPLPEIEISLILYQKSGVNSYYLIYPTEWLEGFSSADYLIYQSDHPEIGWSPRYD